MLRTYIYPLKPTKTQEKVLVEWLNACQQLYNAALGQRRDAYKKQHKSLSLYGQQKELTELRTEPEWEAISAVVLRSSLIRVDWAFKAFFQRVKAGEKPGYPRFRAKDRYDSFSFDDVVVKDKRVQIPKLGLVKFSKYRPLPMGSKIKEARIVRARTEKWHVHFVLDLGEAPAPIEPKTSVGIDVGLLHFATLSNGEQITNPRFYRKGEEVLARRQQALARKQKGSASRRRAKVLAAKAYAHVRNQRRDFVRKTAKELVSKYDLIAVEDLNIRKMAHGNLSKSIHDAGWRQFINALTYKAEEAGKWALKVNPRGTSQRCSGCGGVVKKDLSERIHDCPFCGLVIDRDHNAALNILALGLSALEAYWSTVGGMRSLERRGKARDHPSYSVGPANNGNSESQYQTFSS